MEGDQKEKTVNISPEGAMRTEGTSPNVPATKPSVVRTFESDLAGVMKNKKGSVMKIALAEQRRRDPGLSTPEDKSRKSIFFLLISILLVLVGITFLGFIYVENKTPVSGGPAVAKGSGFIFADSKKDIPVENFSQAKLITAVGLEIKDQNIRLDNIVELYFTEPLGDGRKNITTDEFFELLGVRIPSVLLRSLKENFMLGVHAFNGNQLFMVLKTDFYENAFLGLLRWEKTMAADLLPLFGIKFEGENRALIDTPFQDITIKNRDVRVLKGSSGKTVLIYGIPDKDTIVIAGNEDAFEEVVDRLNAPTR